ncbi:hypothetical protein [Nocardia sp. NPDC047038]|uniref:hypothetical protein n=1 Tax=Nocardia sp. NPDC047038 TaxID=3154338 RepID=UPI0033F8D220
MSIFRPAPACPDMNRLLGIRHGSVTPATTIEDALDTVHDIWAAYLAGIDIVDSHDWTLHGGQAALARATKAIVSNSPNGSATPRRSLAPR